MEEGEQEKWNECEEELQYDEMLDRRRRMNGMGGSSQVWRRDGDCRDAIFV